jgi:hypothetical protein
MGSFCSNAGAVIAGVRFNNDGTIDIRGQGCGPFAFDQNFLTVGGFAGAADDFEILLTVNAFSGPTGGDSIDTFLPLTSGRSWTWDDFMVFDMGDWGITVREVADTGNTDTDEYSWAVEDGS